MSAKTSIQWTDKSWNPVRGCTRVSEGCRNCYAETYAARNLPGMRSPTTGKAFAVRTKGGPRWTGAVELIPKALDEPLRWRKPLKVFVNSMSDLFHESLPDDAIDCVFAVMALAPRHTFQILTKRPARMRHYLAAEPRVRWYELIKGWAAGHADYLTDYIRVNGWPALNPDIGGDPLDHIWLGVSVEDQATADARIPLLLQTPAAVRFVSLEPQLEHVRLPLQRSTCCGQTWLSYLPGSMLERSSTFCPTCGWAITAHGAATSIHQVIQGGESGHGARPFDLAWARAVRDQCRVGQVAYFLKQLGALPFDGHLTAKELVEGGKGRPRPVDQSLTEEAARAVVSADLAALAVPRILTLRDRKGGVMDEWPEDLRIREFPK